MPDKMKTSHPHESLWTFSSYIFMYYFMRQYMSHGSRVLVL